MGISPRQILDALRAEGWFDASFCNTGGGVFNVVFEPVCQHGVRLGSVNLSDSGEWTAADMDTPAESVGVSCYAPNGDWMGEDGTVPDWTVSDALGAVLAADQMSADLERFCAKCVADRGGAA